MEQSDQSINLIRVEDIRFFVDLLMQLDGDAYQILREATIPNDIHQSDSYEFLPESALKNAVEVLGSHHTQADLALIFWEGIRRDYIRRFVSRLSKHDTLLEACEELSQLVKLASPSSRIYPKYTAGSWWLTREKAGQHEQWYEHAELFSVLFMIEFIRSLTHVTWSPEQIALVSSNSDAFSSLPTLNNVSFICERNLAGIKIPDSLMEGEIKNLSKAFETDRVGIDHIAYSTPSFMDTFKLALSPYLSMGKLPIKIAAEILRLNVRTLQRRLAKEGLVYQALIEDMTFELIKDAMRSSDESITAIANKFGYSDAAHFSRAFKRRYDQTPSAYRKAGISK
ncbi:helix-turn-helix transcriptional regulator [Vibrio superstes]|nr:helix-turn-helix transcriptional regulator [Vibrio superstes]